jgi:RNA polymerase sigma factor (sigma-70 family)
MRAKVSTVGRELDPEVVRQALHDDGPEARRAFERLYWHYEPQVRYSTISAARMADHRHDVDELCQEVWCRLVGRNRRLLRYYDPNRGSFGGFIRRLSFQQAINAIRSDQRGSIAGKQALDADEVEDERTSAIVAHLIQSELYDHLMRRAAATLDDIDRVLLREILLGQRPAVDVAAELGLTAARVYQRNTRLKLKLKRWSAELWGEPLPASPDGMEVSMPPLAVIVAAVLAGLVALERDQVAAKDPSTPAAHDAT